MANDTYGAIKLSDANAVGSMLVKKMGGSGYAPKDWADTINLMGKLPEKTVSGGVAHIEDGANDVPISDFVCTVDANLNGVSSVNITHAKKNLADLSSFVDGYVNTNGTFNTAHNNGEMRSDFIPVKPNTQYYFSIIETTGTADAWVGIGHYSSASLNGFIKRTGFWSFTTDANTKYIVVSARNLATATKIQLEVGSSATSYEAYTTPTVTNVPLGRTIYGGTADVVTGEGVDGYGYIVFDGSSDENWGGYSAYNGYYIGISDIKSGTRQDGVCNQLTCSKSNAQGQTDAFWLGVGNKNLYVIGVYDSMGSTLEAFKAYLAENPLIVVYPLATETPFTFTPITPTPHTALGTNNLWNDCGDSEVTYRRDIDLALNSGSSLLGFGLGNPNVGQESEE